MRDRESFDMTCVILLVLASLIPTGSVKPGRLALRTNDSGQAESGFQQPSSRFAHGHPLPGRSQTP
jgi:hypothetical protein